MAETPLTFSQVKGRFRLIDVNWCEPWGDGRGYFVGFDSSNRPNDFPYATGPRIFVGKHAADELIPLKVIYKWLHQLGVVGTPLAQFWDIEDHDDASK